MADAIKTQPTDVPVNDFLGAAEPAGRREDGFALREMFDRITGVEPVMWGPSMVGYGVYHYKGRASEGDWPIVAFSPRKASMSLYGLQVPENEELIPALGKAKLGAGCIWVGRLSGIDQDVLEQMITRAWERPQT